MRILGIDPGYAIVGYGVIEAKNGAYRPLEYGAVTTPAGADFGERLREIYDGMCQLLDTLQPQACTRSASDPHEDHRRELESKGQSCRDG